MNEQINYFKKGGECINKEGIDSILRMAEEKETAFLKKIMTLFRQNNVADLLKFLNSSNEDLFNFINQKAIPMKWLRKMFSDNERQNLFTEAIANYYNINKRSEISFNIHPEKRERFLIGLQGVFGIITRNNFIAKIGSLSGESIDSEETAYQIGKKSIKRFMDNGKIPNEWIDALIWERGEDAVKFFDRWCPKDKKGKTKKGGRKMEKHNKKEHDKIKNASTQLFSEHMENAREILEWIWSLIVSEVGRHDAENMEFIRKDLLAGALVRSFPQYSFKIKDNGNVLQIVSKKNGENFSINMDDILRK